jgi:DNA-binding NarL/FixJ family response regulator
MIEINLIITDDSEIFRFGVKSILEEERNYKINFWEASGSTELFYLLENKNLNPDIILLDIKLKKYASLSGIEIAKRIKLSRDDIKIIILTAFDDKDVLRQALKAGVDGFLPKESVSEEIIESIKTVLSGTNYLGKTIPFEAIQHAFNITPKRYDILTKTEKTIFILISEGNTNIEIADKLHISIHTVETHKSNVKNKLGIKCDVDFLAIAIEDEIDEIMKFYNLRKGIEI